MLAHPLHSGQQFHALPAVIVFYVQIEVDDEHQKGKYQMVVAVGCKGKVAEIGTGAEGREFGGQVEVACVSDVFFLCFECLYFRLVESAWIVHKL